MNHRPNNSSVITIIPFALTLGTGSVIADSAKIEGTANDLLKQREELDKTIWVDEVVAQEYETIFIKLWDRLRAAEGAEKLATLADFPITGELRWGTPNASETLEMGIKMTSFEAEPAKILDAAKRAKLVQQLDEEGIEIVQTEWHHSRFVPGNESDAPKSTISFKIDALKKATATTFSIKGDLEVEWMNPKPGDSKESPLANHITVSGLKVQELSNGGNFRPFLDARHGPDEWISAYPVLVYDLDGDGLSEIIIPRWNRVYWNKGERKFERQFEEGKFLDHPIEIWEAGIIADFNNDGNADFITVGKDGKPYFYAGDEKGRFPSQKVACADIHFDMPSAVTAGDADGDGDLDLWMTQYKLSFMEGQMPTPYYDANDGPPSYFLENDGTGSFTDITEKAGLAPLRNRRSYSASFIDLDNDHDLDLINVSDYAGLDIYENDGKGQFTLATADYVDGRHFFGMGHTFGDYNNDGLLDFYVIGMSSTTARRLDRLNLGREDRPDIHKMRAAMGYGNRLYFGTEEKKFREDPQVAAAVARTGWSWGTTTFDFDLDGDQDIYVANGHRSGKSTQDYCTTFWRHDIYTGDSKENEKVLKVFQSTLLDLNQDKISWNGYEKNVMFANNPGHSGNFVNSAFMFGGAFEFDARSVISDDFNADGKPDLIVGESRWNGRGTELIIRAFMNEVEIDKSNNWFSVHLRESPGPGYSPNGAKVKITDDSGRSQTRWIVTGDSFYAQHAPIAHFGLGHAKGVRSIEVTWPNGKTEIHDAGSAVNTTVTLRGGDK